MVIKLSEIPPDVKDRWERLIPLFLTGEELTTDMVAAKLGCHKTSVSMVIARMRSYGLPIPQIGKRDDVKDYGKCPSCGEAYLSVGYVTERKAIRYCQECGWDAVTRRKTLVAKRDWVTTKEAARMLNVAPKTIGRWVREGTLESLPRANAARKVAYRIPIEAVEARMNGRHS